MDKVDWIMVFATFMGPILAVQAQKAVENFRQRRDRKSNVFVQLMATRAARVSAEHVRALNLIDIVFYGGNTLFGFRRRSRKEQAVLAAWKEYHDHLNLGSGAEGEGLRMWNIQREELFTNLIFVMSQDVGFDFDRVQLKRGGYSPVAHENLENEERALRKAVISGLSGEKPMKMEVVGMPVNEVAAAEIRENVRRIATALEAQVPPEARVGQAQGAA